jgi:hypothetical protein
MQAPINRPPTSITAAIAVMMSIFKISPYRLDRDYGLPAGPKGSVACRRVSATRSNLSCLSVKAPRLRLRPDKKALQCSILHRLRVVSGRKVRGKDGRGATESCP